MPLICIYKYDYYLILILEGIIICNPVDSKFQANFT